MIFIRVSFLVFRKLFVCVDGREFFSIVASSRSIITRLLRLVAPERISTFPLGISKKSASFSIVLYLLLHLWGVISAL
ncbi:MAG: hypothetical protein KatS3mg089_0598 [Patescibacteria group bacterium]|nr:MAG: hypothetical protein KatS3mg089_0598 [Patescibacteria group bacterium]